MSCTTSCRIIHNSFLHFSTGIGLATVQQLAKAGAKVYLAARNESRATGALAQLEAEGLNNIHWHKLDLDDPREVKKSAEEFMKREDRLDVLGASFALNLSNTLIWLSQ